MKKRGKKTIILSLGGSLICPDVVDVNFLNKFRGVILNHRDKKFIISCGGGTLARNYIKSANKITKLHNTDNDLVGIMATRLNAELVRGIFSAEAHKRVIHDPNKKVNFGRILVAAGNKPGASSDYDAVMLAKTFNADEVINLTNVDYVYDKDPKKYRSAKPIKHMKWAEFRKIVGGKWKAGMNLPFDPVASAAAERLKIKVVLMNGRKLKNFDSHLKGRAFVGTIIE